MADGTGHQVGGKGHLTLLVWNVAQMAVGLRRLLSTAGGTAQQFVLPLAFVIGILKVVEGRLHLRLGGLEQGGGAAGGEDANLVVDVRRLGVAEHGIAAQGLLV